MINVNKPVTQAQKDLIEVMQEYGCGLFEGKTSKEASEWINKHREEYELNTIDGWALDNGYF